MTMTFRLDQKSKMGRVLATFAYLHFAHCVHIYVSNYFNPIMIFEYLATQFQSENGFICAKFEFVFFSNVFYKFQIDFIRRLVQLLFIEYVLNAS